MTEIVTQQIGGRSVSIETGHIAKQANGSVIVRTGDLVILCTATMSKSPRVGADFFPLTIEYIEKMYASGKIPGGFFKRETRPATSATLTARLIDRPLRPSFPADFHHDVQVVATILSYDKSISPEYLALIGCSAAVSVSDIPFNGPVGAAHVVEVDGQLKSDATFEEIENSTLDLIVSGTKDAVLMIEAGASEVSEERILEAIQFGHGVIKESVVLQESLVSKSSKPKATFELPEQDASLQTQIASFMGDKVAQNMQSGNKQEVDDFLSQLQGDVLSEFGTEEPDNSALVKRIYSQLKKEKIRDVIITQKIRPDGRKLDEIRPISVDLGLLPSVHGSAVFTRGETQSLGVVTLGTTADEQIDDGIRETVRQKYYFHYNFPPYSVGECGFLGRTSRRELGHGALAQRALKPVLPAYDDFPYTLRIVSEILESNGSSSMASVCSGSLSMMQGGVPIKNPVSGIAMGLLIKDGEYSVLSDIQGLEDHYGDMDFKVAGTKEGITALQLDIKVAGLSESILRDALTQAKAGRLHILDVMNTTISEPSKVMAPSAPKIEFIKIDPEKVGMLIGPGGKNIRKIEEESEASVFVVDGTKGEVSISSANTESMDVARRMISLLCDDPEVGAEYTGKIVKLVNFGAFIELEGTGREGLLHISKVADHRVEKIEDYLEVGGEVPIKIDSVDDNGKISLVRTDLTKS